MPCRSWNQTPLRRINPTSIREIEVQEITKSHPEVFTVDNACKVDTQLKTEMESEQY